MKFPESNRFVTPENVQKTLSERVKENEWLNTQVTQCPRLMEYLDREDARLLDNPELLEVFLKNALLREEAFTEMRSSFKNRLETNLYASEEEVEAGIYWECLEPQVRSSIITLRQKGYQTFESGFENLKTGSQFLGVTKGQLTFSVSQSLIEKLRERGINIEVVSLEDRDSLTLKPQRSLSLDEWREIWGIISQTLPEIKTPLSLTETLSAKNFREKQEKIKRGESVYVGFGFSDLWVENGKVVNKSSQ
ncbi:MAG: hypothetical protein WCI41_03540 [bacterium]